MKVNIGPYLTSEELTTHPERERVVSVEIDDYDVWSADHTLALIIHPVLKRLQENKHGAPFVENKYVPEYLHTIDDNSDNPKFFEKWDYVLNEMIFAFGKILEEDWESEFYTGEVNLLWEPVLKDGTTLDPISLDEGLPEDAKYYTMVYGPNHTASIDKEGLAKMKQRIQNGLNLFATFYFNLWD